MTASRILVVDDEADIRELLQEILSEEGYDVEVAANAAEAKGCIKGAVVGGVAGHMAGHGAMGAAAGCAVGHHMAHKSAQTAANH